MESTISFQDQEHEKSSQKGFYERTLLAEDIGKSETPELPHPVLTELPVKRRYSKPSFVLPSLDENSKAPTPTPSAPSSRRSSASEVLGALPSHEQLRRFSIASNKTDSTFYHIDSQRTSPFQSGASSKVQSPLITGRKGSVSSILKGESETSAQVDYQTDPLGSLSIGPSATPDPSELKTEPQGHPDLSSFIEMSSHSPYAYVPVSSYWPYSGVPYSVLGGTPSFYLPQLPSPQHASIYGVSSDVGLPKKQSRRKSKRKDSLKKGQPVSPGKEPQPLSQAPTPATTPKAAPQSTQETKMGPMMLGNVSPGGPPGGEFDGFQDDYLEDSEYKYKTAICRSHLGTGYCEYGPACQYAHGVQELRPRDFDVKFKTELCKNYHAMGMCWFGSRCRFIHDEYRLQAGENEFWLVAPSENLVRIELVDPENTARKKLLQSLVSLPPRFFPKPEFTHEIPPQLAQLPQFQSLTQQFQLSIPPVSTQIPVFPLPPSPTAIPPYAFQPPHGPPQKTPTPQQNHQVPQQPILSHTAPTFIPGRFASYLPTFVQTQPQQTVPISTQGMVEVHPTASMPETGLKTPTPAPLVHTEISQERMNPSSLWQLTQNPPPTVQLHNTFPLPASGTMLDPREGPKFSLFTTSSTVRAPPPPRTSRDSRTERKKGSRRRKSKSKKNQQGAPGQSPRAPSGRKHNLEALSISQSQPGSQSVAKASPGQKASQLTTPRTHPPTPPISQLASPMSFPVLAHTTSRAPKTVSKDVTPPAFSVFESAHGVAPYATGDSRVPPSPSFQPTHSFPQSYTTLPSTVGSPKQASPSIARGRPWGRGAGRGGRGGLSRGVPSHVTPTYYH